MATKNPLVDAYIAKSQPFARPILTRIRAAAHRACPTIEERLKWGAPSFEHKGAVCLMASFKAHCVLNFSKAALLDDPKGALQVRQRTAMGHLGRIESLKKLPPAAALVGLIKQAVALNEAGVKAPRVAKKRTAIATPAYFMAAVRKNAKALATWNGFTPACKREYLEWVTEAKQDATRGRRLATTVAWLAEGKQRNWKYMPTARGRRA